MRCGTVRHSIDCTGGTVPSGCLCADNDRVECLVKVRTARARLGMHRGPCCVEFCCVVLWCPLQFSVCLWWHRHHFGLALARPSILAVRTAGYWAEIFLRSMAISRPLRYMFRRQRNDSPSAGLKARRVVWWVAVKTAGLQAGYGSSSSTQCMGGLVGAVTWALLPSLLLPGRFCLRLCHRCRKRCLSLLFFCHRHHR